VVVLTAVVARVVDVTITVDEETTVDVVDVLPDVLLD